MERPFGPSPSRRYLIGVRIVKRAWDEYYYNDSYDTLVSSRSVNVWKNQ